MLLDGEHLSRRRSRPASRSMSRPSPSGWQADRSGGSRCAREGAHGRPRHRSGARRDQPRPDARPGSSRSRASPGDHARAASSARRRRSSLMLHDVQDPGNVGAIVRAAEGCGATGVICSERHRRSVRLEGAARRHGQHVSPAGRRAGSRSPRRSRGARARGLRVLATMPRDGTSAAATATCAARRRAARRRRRRAARRARSTPADARLTIPMQRAGRIAQRRDCRGAHALRSLATAAAGTLTMSLFDDPGARRARTRPSSAPSPLAERMRPRTLDEFVGQDALIGPGRPLRQAIEQDRLQSIILWGPPGTGKTTLARLIASVDARALRLVQRRAVRHQGDPRGHGGGRRGAAAPRAAARSSSSTRSTASTRRSRTPSCRASRPATSCSSARRPRTRRSR